MPKRLLLALLLLFIILAGLEVTKLLQLRSNITGYADYWKQQSSLPGDFTLVVLGDSAAQGLGTSQPQYSYVSLVASRISHATGKSVRIVNLSVSGATVYDVTSLQLPLLNKYHPDLIIVEVGGNDVVHWNEHDFAKQYARLASSLPVGSVVSDIPFFGGRIRKNSQALTASQIIAQEATKNQLHLVHLQQETQKRNSLLNYGADLFHPSNRGYRIWTDAFWKTIAPLLNS